MNGRIILLTDSKEIQDAAVNYSIELAKRTEAKLAFLSIFPIGEISGDGSGSAAADDLQTVKERLIDFESAADSSGVETSITTIFGDPYSELMKYLASHNDVKSIVWAGSPDLADDSKNKNRNHWLARSKGKLECPLVVPVVKTK